MDAELLLDPLEDEQKSGEALIVRDEKYYMEGADCVILVENVLFKVRSILSLLVGMEFMGRRFIDSCYPEIPPLFKTCLQCPLLPKDQPTKIPSFLQGNRPKAFVL